MKKIILLCLVGFSVVLNGLGQNLVGNPGFENLPAWDSLWFLSLKNPSSNSALATQITTDAHEGVSSLELSNTKDAKWSYFYSDDLNAPINFIANKSYVVSGWMKSVVEANAADISIFWNGSLNSQTIFTGNPNPISEPDWFEVIDTISPSADYSDGYLRLGLLATKDASNKGAGKLLFDDFSVVRLPDNTETDITFFSIPEQTAPPVIDAAAGTISIVVPKGTDMSTLTPDAIILSRAATVTPGAGVTQNFLNPVSYQVTAQDETTSREWTVFVRQSPNVETDITDFSFSEETRPPIIDESRSVISAEVEYGTDLTRLTPAISLSYGATVIPGKDIANDFTSPAIYTVIAEDNMAIDDWIITVGMAPAANETDILTFVLGEQSGPAVIDTNNHTIRIEVVKHSDLSKLTPAISISPGANLELASGVTQDFTNDVIYSVTAEDGTTIQKWTVSVTGIPLNIQTDIQTFKLNEEASPAIIDSNNHTVVVSVPYGTVVSALVPEITVSDGATIVPDSGVTMNFSNAVIYKVTAEDGITVQDWEVTIQILPNTEHDIVSFSVPEQKAPSSIDAINHAVKIQVVKGTNISALTPTISVSPGATIERPSGVTQDFTNNVLYIVTAENGSTQIWIVTINADPLNKETNIIEFSIFEQAAPSIIDSINHTIQIEIVKDADITALTPTISVSPGATIELASGITADFTNDVTYTVTAEDGSTTQTWIAMVTIDPSVNINNLSNEGFRIYPNPASEYVRIELDAFADIRLLDITGKVVYREDNATGTRSIYVADYKKGMYLLLLEQDGIKHLKKLIIR